MALSAFEIATSAMAPELSTDYRKRGRLFLLRYWFAYAGAFGFTAFSLSVLFAAAPEFPRGKLNSAGSNDFAPTGAVVIVVVIMVCGKHPRRCWPMWSRIRR